MKNSSVNNNDEVIEYFVYPDPVKFHGINNKINQTVIGLKKNGYTAAKVTAPSGLKGILSLAKRLLTTKADVIIFRNTFLMPFFLPSIIWLRVTRRTIIIDLPTPITNVMHEFKMRNNIGFVRKWLRILMVSITYPWVYLPVNKILQYAPESDYFSLFICRKMLRIANGIDVGSVPEKQNQAQWSGESLTIIAVANMADWHGFDRVIRGIAKYKEQGNKMPVTFIVVGGGEFKEEWKSLSEKLGLLQQVIFAGFKKGKELDALFDDADIAVSSLALFRINIEEASVLKSREYTARGLPFIASGIDSDFQPNPSFLFHVENNEDDIDIKDVITWYKKLSADDKLESRIRQYALDKLDFEKKVKYFLANSLT